MSNCPLCDAGHKTTTRYTFNAVSHDGVVYQTSVSETIRDAMLKIYLEELERTKLETNRLKKLRSFKMNRLYYQSASKFRFPIQTIDPYFRHRNQPMW